MTLLLLLLLIASLVLLWLQTDKLKKTKDDLADANGQIALYKEQTTEQLSHIEKLSRYQGILDAEALAISIKASAENEVKSIIGKAEEDAADLRRTASDIVNAAKGQAKQVIEQAEIKARTLQAQADNIRLNADHEAKRIISAANTKAEEIAGEALEAIRKSGEIQKVIQALNNKISGYGDQYLVPSYTLLDELAIEFGHVEAGVELKKARERTRLMIFRRKTAVCDYVENVRKTSAENFVTDAFNGKVDSILATVKHDNFGTLAQQIKDAYALVNHLGKPFKDARITAEYLDSRLEELRWAVIAHELKLKEREEQRAIKEQIREEERARREFEKAQRDAAKQEEAIQKAIDKVQLQAARASEEQREIYEQQLRELAAKLQAAQEKNQRALSMAQQTRSGHVYIISNIGSFGEHVYKIGMTRRLEPLDRVKELGDASVPFEFDVHAMMFSDDAPALEKDLHRHFLNNQINKVNPRKEFFRVDLSQVKNHIDQLGIESKWTLLAEAREFRESQAIEKAIANNTLDREAWEKFQLENLPAEFEEEEQEAS